MMTVEHIWGIEGGRFVERWPLTSGEKMKRVGEVLSAVKSFRHI